MRKGWLAFCMALMLSGALVACAGTQTTSQAVSSAPVENDVVDAPEENSLFPLGDSGQTYGGTFGQGEVIEVYIELAEADWEDILANPMAAEYHTASVTVNGTTVENVGFRTKGNSSLSAVAASDSDRYGFRVKIDKYEKGQTLNGLDEFVLNASFADPSYMREYLTYAAMAHLGGVTPYMGYANLYINGELHGFYLMIEALDDSFVERLTDDSNASLYKADGQSCTLTESDTAGGFKVSVGSDEEMANIKALIETLNRTTPENVEPLAAMLDVDSVLRAIAVNTVMGNYDSYSGSMAHNYFLLYADGKFTYVGWDYNMSIGGFTEDGGSSVGADITEPVFGVDISRRPLIEKLLAVDEYYARYMEYVQQLVEYFGDFAERVEQMAAVLRPYIAADPTAFYTMEQFENNIVATGADLSENTGMGGFGGMELPEGMEDFSPGDGFALPEGFDMPEGMEGFGGGMPGMGGGPGGMRNGEGMEGMEGGEWGEMPNGMEMPAGFEPPEGMGGGFGGIIDSEPVSIVDYIQQRLENIMAQLGE